MNYVLIINDKFYAGNMQFTKNFAMAKRIDKETANFIKSKLDNQINKVEIITVVDYLKRKSVVFKLEV